MMPSKIEIFDCWEKMLGHPSKFSLNARIFHATCLISVLGLGYNVPFNYLIGLPKIAFISFLSLVIVIILYYFSRFKHRYAESIVIMNILGLCLFTFNYFLNSGSNGPTDVYFLLLLLLSIGMSPASQYKIWVPLNLSIVMALHLLEYFNPDLIPITYTGRSNKFIDISSTYVVVALLAFPFISYIRSNYEKEKQSALEKTVDIELRNQQILSQNQKLKILDDEKNKLLSIIAHDLRSPLSSIQSFLELLTQFDLEPEQRSKIEIDLLDSTTNTISMLSKLLDWSKSQLHGVSPSFKNINLYKLIQEVINLEKHAATRKAIALHFDIAPSLMIYADRNMMQVVLRNLIGNAIKFTSANGKISILSEHTDSACIISIRDNGIGISADQQSELFSLQARSTYGTENEKGVGLGLLLCKEFINAQNGDLWFLSSLSEGTCFYVSIPLTQQDHKFDSILVQ